MSIRKRRKQIENKLEVLTQPTFDRARPHLIRLDRVVDNHEQKLIDISKIILLQHNLLKYSYIIVAILFAIVIALLVLSCYINH